jgi:ubiquinone/menaquinone biosynthesis C-methylase UbiE
MSAQDDAARERLAREIEFHRKIADHAEFVWNWETPSGRRRADRRAAIFIEEGRLAPGCKALELGCGTGVFLEKVAGSGAEIHGLDLSEDLLAKARARLHAFPNVTLHEGNAERSPFPAEHFDTVYGSSVLHHLDLDAALREAARVLRPGGRLVFTEPNILNPQVVVMFKLGLTKNYFGVSPDEMAFSRFRAQRALANAGFREFSVTPFDFMHPAIPARGLDFMARVGRALERLPVVREIAGSMILKARRG